MIPGWRRDKMFVCEGSCTDTYIPDRIYLELRPMEYLPELGEGTIWCRECWEKYNRPQYIAKRGGFYMVPWKIAAGLLLEHEG